VKSARGLTLRRVRHSDLRNEFLVFGGHYLAYFLSVSNNIAPDELKKGLRNH
jgi:hypothetical protein